MKIKNKIFAFVVFLIILLIFLVLVEKKRKSQSIINNLNLQPGKIISSLWIKDVEGNELNFLALQDSRISGIFILPKVCLTCNPNFYFLEKLSNTYPTKITPLWIVPQQFSTFKKNFKLDSSIYPVHIPVHLETFLKEFDVLFKSNPQVTLLHGNRVIYSKVGELDTEDFFTMRKILKQQ